MIKIYNTNHQFLGLLDRHCKNINFIDTLDLGIRELSFCFPCAQEYFDLFQEENYVETIDYNFIIKEIFAQNNDFVEVRCGPDIEDISGKIIQHFDVFQLPPKDAYEYCLQDTGWTVDYQSKDRTILTYQLDYQNAYDMIKTIAFDQGHEYWFDTKNKVLQVYDKIGKTLGAYFSNELKLKQLKKQSNSYDYATVLYPIGKNGLTIRDVNNNKPYITNFSYSKKYIEKLYFLEDVEIPEILLQKGKEYLEEICVPRASYNVSISSLNQDVNIGDVIMIVDNIKHIKQKQRVVKIIRYPFEPERDKVEISNLAPDFIIDYFNGTKETKKELSFLKSYYSSIGKQMNDANKSIGDLDKIVKKLNGWANEKQPNWDSYEPSK